MSPSSTKIVSLLPDHREPSFAGFSRPTANYYRLPNDWFDIWQQVRNTLGKGNRSVRVIAPLKITEYIIKWTWGWSNFESPLRISRTELRTGRLDRYGSPLDQGTGLGSEASISRGIDLSTRLGLLEQTLVTDDLARQERYLLPRLQPPAAEPLPRAAVPEPFAGFSFPTQNYFVVPKSWSDIAANIRSEVLILSVEYLFRHTWGWQMRDGEVRWLDVDEVAAGRRYRSPERQGERYDGGTGYSQRQVRAALASGVERGLLVWRNGSAGQREYALRMDWMQNVQLDGYYQPIAAEEAELGAKPVGGTAKLVGGAAEPVGGTAEFVGGAAEPVGPTAKPVGGMAKLVGGAAEPVGPTAEPVGRTCKDTDSKTLASNTSIKPPSATNRPPPPPAADGPDEDQYQIYFRPELPDGESGEVQRLMVAEAADVALTQPGTFYWSAADLENPRDLDAGERFTEDEIAAQTALDAAIFSDDRAVVLDADQCCRRPMRDLAQTDRPIIHDLWQLLDLPRPPDLEPDLAARRQRLDSLREQHTAWGHPDLLTALEVIGIARTDAERLLTQYGAPQVGGWLRTVRQNAGRLTNPAGLLINKLRAGEPPPGGPMTVTPSSRGSPNSTANISQLLTQLLVSLHQLDDSRLVNLTALLERMAQELSIIDCDRQTNQWQSIQNSKLKTQNSYSTEVK